MGQTSTSPIGKQSKALGARLCAVAARASPQRHIRGRQGRRASSGRCGRQTGWQQHIRRHGSWCCGGRTADGHAALRRQPARISWCCGGSPAGRSWYCGGSTAVDHGAETPLARHFIIGLSILASRSSLICGGSISITAWSATRARSSRTPPASPPPPHSAPPPRRRPRR